MTEEETRNLFCSIFDYNSLTGELIRKTNRGKAKAGSSAGVIRSDGRLQIWVKGKTYLSHRAIWLMVTGSWPSQMVDHINGNPKDNRFANLRDVSNAVNAQNQRLSQRRSKTGMLGVVTHRRKGVYSSTICVDGVRTWLGYHASPEQAHQAYLVAKRNFHQGCTI